MFIKKHKIIFLLSMVIIATVAITATGNFIALEPVLPW